MPPYQASEAPKLLPKPAAPQGSATVVTATTPQIHLCDMSLQERIDYYRQAFADNVVPLDLLTTPTECETNPAFRDEILDAYYQHTTFTVTVYINYDTASKRWYNHEEHHYNACGKLFINPSFLDYLDRLDPNLQLRKVRFEVYALDTKLCTFQVKATPAEPYNGFRVEVELRHVKKNAHPQVVSYMDELKKDIESWPDQLNDLRGFILVHLEILAEYFRNEPRQKPDPIDRNWNVLKATSRKYARVEVGDWSF